MHGHDREERADDGIDESEYGNGEIGTGQAEHHLTQQVFLGKDDGQNTQQHRGTQYMTQTAQHGSAEQFVIPTNAGTFDNRPHQSHHHNSTEIVEKDDHQQNQQKSHPTAPTVKYRCQPQPFEQGIRPPFQKRLHTHTTYTKSAPYKDKKGLQIVLQASIVIQREVPLPPRSSG